MRDSLLRVGTTGVHENERGESGNLDEFFRETIFREAWGRMNANRTSLTFLPENVNEYGPVNVMYFTILIGMISGAYLLARAPATKDSSAEKIAEEIDERSGKKRNEKDEIAVSSSSSVDFMTKEQQHVVTHIINTTPHFAPISYF